MEAGHRSVRLAAAVLIMMAFASPRLARASEADELIRQGVTLRRSGDDVAALKRFEQAFQLEHSSRALAQIGLAEQALGRWAASYEHLQQALEDTRDPWIKKSRATLRQALDVVSDHVGQLEVLGGSPDAEVRIDGVPRGRLPLVRALAVSSGTVTDELVAPRFVPVQRTTVVRARQTVRESFDALVPVFTGASGTATSPAPSADGAALPAAAPPPARSAAGAALPAAAPPRLAASSPAALPPAAPVAADPSPNGAPGAVEKAKADQSPPSSFRPKVKWIVWGAGGAALAAGIVGMVRQNQAGDDFDAGCAVGSGQTVMPLPGSTRTASDCRSLKDRVDSNYRLELIGYVTAGALAAAGLVLWLTEPAASGGEATALACSPGLTARGPQLGCALTF
jgi:hypothetical protein